MIAGIDPTESVEITIDDAAETLRVLDEKLSGELAAIFTISYDLGLKLLGIDSRKKPFANQPEPDIFLALFDCLIIHDYTTKRSFLTGNDERFDAVEAKLSKAQAERWAARSMQMSA